MDRTENGWDRDGTYTQPKSASKGAGLRGNALLKASVATENVSEVVKQLKPITIVCGCKVLLGHCQSNGV